MADTYVNTAMASSHITSLMRRINALEASVSTSGGVYVSQFGSYGTGNGQFIGPLTNAIHNGEIYVVDSNNSRIQVFDLDGNYVRKWTTPSVPMGIFLYSNEVYVPLFSDNLYVYNTTGTLQRSWAVTVNSGGAIDRQLWVGGGEVYIPTSIANDSIEVYNTVGIYQRTIGGTLGSGNGEFNRCLGVYVYSGEVYAVDSLNHRIQVFNTAGTYQRQWGTNGIGDGQFDQPREIFVDGSGNVYVTDTLNDRVQVFDTNGVFQYKFGSSGTGNGQFDVATGITVYASSIYVSDAGTSTGRVQVFTSDIGGAQTTFFSYTATAATSLGTPDGGVSIPALAALTPANNNADLVPRHIVDMRDAIEALAPYFTNPATSAPYTWAAADPNNLYYVAVERTQYGASNARAYDWTRTEAQMEGDYAYSLDIGEVASCLDQLEAS